MATSTVKYFKRIGDKTFEPHSTSKADMKRQMDFNNSIDIEEAWCNNCKAVVEPEGAVDVQGGYLRCIWCGEPVKD